MDWNDFRYILAVAREGSLSGAGRQLGVARTTVARRVRELESGAGVQLFERAPGGLVPTAAGREVVRSAEIIEAEAMALERRMMSHETELSGAVRLSTLDALYVRYAGAIRDFVRAHPKVSLTVEASTDLVSLERRQADVLLRQSNAPPEHLVGRRIGSTSYAVFGSAEVAEAAGEDPDFDALPWLAFDEREGLTYLDAWMAAKAPRAKVSVRVSSSALVVREALATSMGVFIYPCETAARDDALVQIGPVQITREVWVLTLPELRSNPTVRALMEHLS